LRLNWICPRGRFSAVVDNAASAATSRPIAAICAAAAACHYEQFRLDVGRDSRFERKIIRRGACVNNSRLRRVLVRKYVDFVPHICSSRAKNYLPACGK
jgi:hypothetical protein